MNKRTLTILIYTCFFLILAAGLFLRFYQYLYGRNIWEDEAHIALNFMHLGYKDLTQPLENFQTAPIFFLFSVETFSRLFGFGAIALRAFPFIVSVLTLPVFYFLVRDLTKNRLTALIAFLLFATNISLIYFSSEIKYYTIDVSVYVWIFYFLVTKNVWIAKRRTLLLAVTGALAILYANAAVVVLFCAACYLLLQRKKLFAGAAVQPAAVILGVWGSVFLVNYFLFIYHHPYSAGMKENWAFTFPPVNIFSPAFSAFIQARTGDTFFTNMLFFSDHYHFPLLLALLLLIAIVQAVWQRNTALLIMTVLPVLVHFVLAMLQLYPFFYRFILYLLPCFMILVSSGISIVAGVLARKRSPVMILPACIFVLYCGYCCVQPSLKNFPMGWREIKPVLDKINHDFPREKLLITTPFTLYEYYEETGYVKNHNREPIPWNLSPGAYYKTVRERTQGNYVLLYSMNGEADGYQAVLDDLQRKGLVISRFEWKTYGVLEARQQ